MFLKKKQEKSEILEIIKTNVLANEVVRHFFNLIARRCWQLGNRVLRAKQALGRIADSNSLEYTSVIDGGVGLKLII